MLKEIDLNVLKYFSAHWLPLKNSLQKHQLQKSNLQALSLVEHRHLTIPSKSKESRVPTSTVY